MSTVIKQLKGKLIVSCQALEDEPLHSSFIMGRMAQAAKIGGASGIRANSIVDIEAIKQSVDLPIIGIIKAEYPNSSVYITPTIKEARQICESGVEIIALDATLRQRPHGEKLADIIVKIRKEYPNVLIMADTATIAEVKNAELLKVDLIGTTLHGYTGETENMDIYNNDFEYLKSVLKVTSLPVIAEGKIDTPEKAKQALDLGCHAVVTGGAITRPQDITKKFVDAINKV